VIAGAKVVDEMAVVDSVADAAADEAGTVVAMVLLPVVVLTKYYFQHVSSVNQNKYFMPDVRQHYHSATH